MGKLLFVILALFLCASPIFAQEAAVTAESAPLDWRGGVGAAVGMAIASGLCALAQGKAAASAAEGIARNPSAAAAIRGVFLLGMILIESLALYTLVIVFLKVE